MRFLGLAKRQSRVLHALLLVEMTNGGSRAAGGEQLPNERGWGGSESCERENILFFFGFYFCISGFIANFAAEFN